MEFINIIDYIGTFAFAISGIRLAAAKNFDWFGAYVVGFVTAVGGGTLRDVMLDVTPFWMEQASYVVITGLALVFVLIFRKYVVRLDNTFFIFDAVGIALFTVVGVEKSIAAGYPVWVNVIMGTITGAAVGCSAISSSMKSLSFSARTSMRWPVLPEVLCIISACGSTFPRLQCRFQPP